MNCLRIPPTDVLMGLAGSKDYETDFELVESRGLVSELARLRERSGGVSRR